MFRRAQATSQGAKDDSCTQPERRAPAALNAISEEVLRAQVIAALGCPAAEEASVRSPLLAPFITHGLLLRVCNILSTIDDNGRSSGLTQQQARSKVVAALAGACHPCLTGCNRRTPRAARGRRARVDCGRRSRPGCQGLRRRAGDGSSAEAMQARKTSTALLMRMQATAAAAKMVWLNDATAKE